MPTRSRIEKGIYRALLQPLKVPFLARNKAIASAGRAQTRSGTRHAKAGGVSRLALPPVCYHRDGRCRPTQLEPTTLPRTPPSRNERNSERRKTTPGGNISTFVGYSSAEPPTCHSQRGEVRSGLRWSPPSPARSGASDSRTGESASSGAQATCCFLLKQTKADPSCRLSRDPVGTGQRSLQVEIGTSLRSG